MRGEEERGCWRLKGGVRTNDGSGVSTENGWVWGELTSTFKLYHLTQNGRVGFDFQLKVPGVQSPKP